MFSISFGSAESRLSIGTVSDFADKLVPSGWFGRGRREGRCAWEEKEEGLLRYVLVRKQLDV